MVRVVHKINGLDEPRCLRCRWYWAYLCRRRPRFGLLEIFLVLVANVTLGAAFAVATRSSNVTRPRCAASLRFGVEAASGCDTTLKPRLSGPIAPVRLVLEAVLGLRIVSFVLVALNHLLGTAVTMLEADGVEGIGAATCLS